MCISRRHICPSSYKIKACKNKYCYDSNVFTNDQSISRKLLQGCNDSACNAHRLTLKYIRTSGTTICNGIVHKIQIFILSIWFGYLRSSTIYVRLFTTPDAMLSSPFSVLLHVRQSLTILLRVRIWKTILLYPVARKAAVIEISLCLLHVRLLPLPLARMAAVIYFNISAVGRQRACHLEEKILYLCDGLWCLTQPLSAASNALFAMILARNTAQMQRKFGWCLKLPCSSQEVGKHISVSFSVGIHVLW